MRAAFSGITAAMAYAGTDAIVLSWKVPGFSIILGYFVQQEDSTLGMAPRGFTLGLHFANSFA